jgi:hypothetical protein
MDLQDVEWEGMAGLICFRIGKSGGLFGSHKNVKSFLTV